MLGLAGSTTREVHAAIAELLNARIRPGLMRVPPRSRTGRTARAYSSGMAAPPEPDPRFLLANERTYLAWVRTSLALLAAAAAVTAVDLPMSLTVQRLMATVLAVIGMASALEGWRSWRRRDAALYANEPIAPARATTLITGGLFLVGVVLIVAILG